MDDGKKIKLTIRKSAQDNPILGVEGINNTNIDQDNNNKDQEVILQSKKGRRDKRKPTLEELRVRAQESAERRNEKKKLERQKKRELKKQREKKLAQERKAEEELENKINNIEEKRKEKYLWQRSRSKYDPKYCDELVEFGKTGKSVELFCKNIGISSKTFYEWCQKYEEFATARELANINVQDYWEHLNSGIANGEEIGNASLVMFNLKTRFHFREKTEHVVIHKSTLADYINAYIEKKGQDIPVNILKAFKILLEDEEENLKKIQSGDLSAYIKPGAQES